jgi:GxxExxY protein
MLHEPTTNVILGSFFEIYRARGYGFLENVYSNSLAVELGTRGLEVRREIPIEVTWKGVSVGTYRMDLVVESEVLVEVKTVERLTEAHNRQLVNYLKATGLEVGLLLNFGPEPQFIRRVNSDDKSRSLRDQSAKTASSADSGPETIRNANNDA